MFGWRGSRRCMRAVGGAIALTSLLSSGMASAQTDTRLAAEPEAAFWVNFLPIVARSEENLASAIGRRDANLPMLVAETFRFVTKRKPAGAGTATFDSCDKAVTGLAHAAMVTSGWSETPPPPAQRGDVQRSFKGGADLYRSNMPACELASGWPTSARTIPDDLPSVE